MIKKSFIIACIAAVAFSMTVQQTEELTEEQEARRAERRAARRAARQAEREANGGSCTKNRLNDAIDNATTDGETATAQTGAQKQLKLIQTRAKAQVKDEMLEVVPGEEVVLKPDKDDKKVKEPKEKKNKPAKPTSLNTEEGEEADSASNASESEDEETEDYDSENESVDPESDSDEDEEESSASDEEDSESSASGEEETVIPDDQNLTPQIKGDILAQLGSSNHDCQFAHRRNKADLDDYWGARAGSALYEDTDFTPDASSFQWSDIGESNQGWNDYQWGRAGEKFSDHSLFGTNGVTPEDVRQGAIGNCWFLSAIAALSEEPGRIESVFVENEKTDQGIYAVTFYTLGVPHTIIIDDFLPVRERWDGSYTTPFSKVGLDQALWAPLLEKAFAKYHGNYGHTVGGDSRRAARTLSGAPYDSHAHQDHDENSIWNLLQSKDNEKDMIQVNTAGNNNDYQDASGLVQGHAYTVLGVETIGNNKLIKMRNPWASELYHAAWCDDCSEWNTVSQEDKDRVGYTQNDDGVFFMPLSLYFTTFTWTHFTHDVTDWHSSYFLMLDDQTQADHPGDFYYCGATCTQHVLTLSSEVEQSVWVTAHTWDRRSMGNTCNALWWDTGKYHSIKAPHDYYYRVFNEGDHQLAPFVLSPNNPIDIVVEFDFSNPQVSADWSVVMWAPDGPVSVTYKNNEYETMHFPLLGDNPDGSGDGGSTPDETTPDETTPDETTPDETTPDETTPDETTPDETTPDETTPDDTTPDDTTPDFDPADLGPQYYDFIDWINGYEPHISFDGCSVGLIEDWEWFLNDAGQWEIQYKTVMKNDCENWNFLITVWMATDEWLSLPEVYETYDENGAVFKTSVVRDCVDVDDMGVPVMACKFEIGHIQDWQDLGLPCPEQRTAGWLNSLNDYGIRGYQYEWIYRWW